jgi:hypothetical protein
MAYEYKPAFQDGNTAGEALEFAGKYGQVENGQLMGPQGGVKEAAGIQDYYQAQRRTTRVREARVKAAATLYADVLNGKLEPRLWQEAMAPREPLFVEYLMRKYPTLFLNESTGRVMGLRETMSVSDYQALYVDVLDRQYYGYYNAYPIVNKPLVRIHSLRDFRVVSRYLLDGAVGPLQVTPVSSGDAAAPAVEKALSGPVPQDGSTYPTTNTAPIQYQPQLYQARTAVNWRAFVNDDLGIFRDLSSRLAICGNRGVSKFITGFFVQASGLNTSLYTAGYGNQIITANGASSNNPSLSLQGLSDALKILAGMRDSTGNPILITGRLKLWFGPSLLVAANNLMNMLNVYVQNEGGTGNTQGFPAEFVNVNNWLIQNMDLVMDPYIPIVCTTSGVQNTAWGIVVDPASQNRPDVEIGFLQGFEAPQIFTKVPNTMRLGGGVDPMLGDFYSMDQEMKIITVMGGTAIDGRSTVASTGQGV